jgi:hypothetical protein
LPGTQPTAADEENGLQKKGRQADRLMKNAGKTGGTSLASCLATSGGTLYTELEIPDLSGTDFSSDAIQEADLS